MKDIGGICELRLSFSCTSGITLLAAATKLVHSFGALGTPRTARAFGAEREIAQGQADALPCWAYGDILQSPWPKHK